MKIKFNSTKLLIVLVICLLSNLTKAETFSIYYQLEIPQYGFAAQDIKTALEQRGSIVELKDISLLSENAAGMKVVIASATNTQVTALMELQGGAIIPQLGEQAYAIRTTATPQKSYWVLGGDENGAMYGGLQIAEYINFNGITEIYNEEDSPYLKSRGVKFNIPLDRDAPTYFYNNGGTSHKLAIRHVWDIDFWKTWFDEMARHRYNVLSLWSPHPFTSMLNMEDEYPGIAINGVTGYLENGSQVNINNMTIDQKIVFWQEVMKYGRSRGFSIYFCTWNIFLSTARGKHGLTDSASDIGTRTYLRKSMRKFLETYPDLAGFGVTVGERMGNITYDEKEEWAWDTYGKGMYEYAIDNPERDLVLIHRHHDGNLNSILNYFSTLNELPNVRLDLSFKYSEAHTHAAVKPTYWDRANMENALNSSNLKSWLTLRNDDFYFLHWGDHQFVRDYVSNFPEVGKYIDAFYIGADGWVFTKEFASKDPFYKNKGALSIEKTWYMQKLWGRISYNPTVSNEIFKNHLALKYPEAPSAELFLAWSEASRSVQLANDQVTGTWNFDFKWWPEGWTSSDGFYNLTQLSSANPMRGSTLCNFQSTANNTCNGITALDNADQIELLAINALAIVSNIDPGANTELRLNLRNLEALCLLGLYNANKFRAAVYMLRDNQNQAREAIQAAYCYWINYTDIMHELYIGVDLQRNRNFDNWKVYDNSALLDYTSLGGVGVPNCSNIFPQVYITSPENNSKYMAPAVLTVDINALTGTNAIDKVDLRINGSLVGTKTYAPCSFEVSNLLVGNYIIEASIVDDQGNMATQSIFIAVGDSSLINTVPWIEDFSLNNGATSNDWLTTWTSARQTGQFMVADQRFVVNGAGSEGVLQSGIIDISGGPVNVSLDVAFQGGVDNGQDYVKFYIKVDQGPEELVGIFDGKRFEGVERKAMEFITMMKNGIVGNTLQLIVKGYVTYSDEFYFIDNLIVQYEGHDILTTHATNGIILLDPAKPSYNKGEEVTLTVIPASGYAFTGWSGDLDGSAITTTIIMDSNKEVTANFVEGYGLNYGTATSYTFDVQYVGTSGASTGSNTSTVTGTNYQELFNNFNLITAPETYTIPVSDGIYQVTHIYREHLPQNVPEGRRLIDISYEGEVYHQGFDMGKAVGDINIANYVVDTVLVVDGELTITYARNAASGAGSVQVNAFKAVKLPEQTSYALTATINFGAATVNLGDLSIDPPGGRYLPGTMVTLTADIHEGYVFNKWIGDIESDENPVTFVMDSDKVISADISLYVPTYSLTINAINGSVSAVPNKETYDPGNVVILIATPNAGYQFERWEGDFSSTLNPAAVVMNKDIETTAVFSLIPQNFSITSNGENGSIALSPSGGTYAEGTEVSITATPNDGYVFVEWGGDLSGTENPVTITVQGNMDVSAIFDFETNVEHFNSSAQNKLSQNYPNPFSVKTSIPYYLNDGANVEVTVYNFLGEKITTLIKGYQDAGSHILEWDGTDAQGNPLSKGIYLYRLVIDNYSTHSKQMMLLK